MCYLDFERLARLDDAGSFFVTRGKSNLKARRRYREERFSRWRRSRFAAILKPDGRFAVVNWHRRPREETTVLGQPRGPKTDMRMTPDDVAAVVEPAGLVLGRFVELPPYHYGAVFQKPAE